MTYGDGLEVAMGGGRGYFLPATTDDPEDEGKKGKRKDGKDLTKAWLDRYGNSGASSGTRSSSTRSIRPMSTTCSASSSARTWSTSTTARRTRPASRRWPR